MGFEPTTSTLARLRSTPELYPHSVERDINYHIRKKMQALILNFCNFFYSLFQIKLTCSVLPRQMVFLSAVSSLTDRLQCGSVGFSSCWAWGMRMTVKAYGVNSSGSGARRFSATARTSRLTFSASRPSESRLVCAFNRAKASRLSLLSRHQETQSSRG